MEYLIHRIFLDMHSVSSQITFRVKQGTTRRKIYITLREGGQPYHIAGDCTAQLSATKPDGNPIYNNCEIVGNAIVYTFTEQTTAVLGIMDCEVILKDQNDEIIVSPHFTIIVEKGVFYGDEIISTPEATALEDIINRANAVIANAERFANAFKGSKNGALIQANDVSPIEHTVGCKVKSKNLFNLEDDYRSGYEYIYSASDRTLTVSGRYIHKFILLEEGKIYTFSCNSSRTGTDGGGIYIRAYDESKTNYIDLTEGELINQLSPTVTVTMPNGYPYIRFAFYGFFATDGSGTSVYTELMLEEGSAATGYTPYLEDFSAVNVSRCGRNLLPYPYSANNFSGDYVTFTVNEDRSVTLVGTNPAAATQFDLASELILPPGTYSFAGNGSNVRARILGVDGSSRYSLDTFTITEGEKIRLYVVALENEEINLTFYPMLNLGSEVLPYEDYVGEKYTPVVDGTLNGMSSLYPYMALFTDTVGTIVSCEYNRDSNKVYEELYNFLEQGGLTGPAARIANVVLLADAWKGTESPYSQVVAVSGVTSNTQVDLTPSVEQLAVFHNKDLAFVTENEGGVVTVYAIGQKPANDYTIQSTLTEVEI